MKSLIIGVLALFLAVPATSLAIIAPPTDDTPENGGGSLYCPNLTQTLRRSMRDASTNPPGQVSELQTFLVDYFELDEEEIVSGFFGRLTQKYLTDFQQKTGLPAYGIAGTLTRAKIAEVCKNGKSNPVACTADYRPVCGKPAYCLRGNTSTNGYSKECAYGKTYGNKCGLSSEGAQFMYEGECKTDREVSCPDFQTPRCGDGEVVVNGEKQSNGCYSAPYCKKKEIPVACTMEYAPVCGKPKYCLTSKFTSDSYPQECQTGKTYGNKCSLNAEGAQYISTGECKPRACPIYNIPRCTSGVVVKGGVGSDGCELPPKCSEDTSIGVSIDPYNQPDKMIGDYISWSVKVQNAMQGSSLVTTLESADGAGRNYAFPGDGASRSVVGTTLVSYSAPILSQPGYDIQQGLYKLHARLLAPNDGSGKDSATHSHAESKAFFIKGRTATKCGVNTFSVRGNRCDIQTNGQGSSAVLAMIAPAPEPSYTSAYFQCYDGYSETMGVDSSCKPVSVWQKYAQEKCANRCSIVPMPNSTQGASPYEAFMWVVGNIRQFAQ